MTGVYKVGGNKSVNNETKLIYCNGIMSDAENAKLQGLIISNAFNGRGVTVIHNPTTVIGSVNDKVVGYFARHSEGQIELEQEVAGELANQIRAQIGPEKAHVVVFAHSHGTQILYRALQKLDETERSFVEVHGMGGIVTIPKKLAGKVENHFNEGDIIARSGNRSFDPNNTIKKCIKIKRRMHIEGIGLRSAIMKQVVEDLEKRLDPLSLPKDVSEEERGNAIGKYGGPFFMNVEMDKETMNSELDKYVHSFKEYNIDWKPSTWKFTSSYDEDDLTDIGEETLEMIKTAVIENDASCHKLASFKGEIERIAAKVMSEEQA